MTLPTFTLRFLPRWVLFRYSDRLRTQLKSLEWDVRETDRLLEEVAPGFEYTAGFRAHLERKLGEWNEERFFLVQVISEVEDVLFPLIP
jgi:hypothetical protein